MATTTTPNEPGEAAVASLPTAVAVVVCESNSVGVELRWGAEATTAPHSTEYSVPPYSFVAVDASGNQPFIKTFGSLLYCAGGILEIQQSRYRIEVHVHDAAASARQHQQKLPSTPPFWRDEGRPLIPPSTGEEPKEESDPIGNPSSDEGIAEGLRRVAASPSMRVSSNSLSIEFVGDLHEITTRDEVEEKFNIAANYVYSNWHRQRLIAGKRGVYKNERWHGNCVQRSQSCSAGRRWPCRPSSGVHWQWINPF